MRLFLLALVFSSTSRACLCEGWPSPKEAWKGSAIVFSGHVDYADPVDGPDGQRLRLTVTEAFKGVENGTTAHLYQPGFNCVPKFERGQRLLIYAVPLDTPKVWHAPGCHRSRDLDKAGDDLLFLRGLPGSAQRTRLAGIVTYQEMSVEHGRRFLRPLSGIQVNIAGPSQNYTVRTNAEGAFEKYDLPAGHYSLSPVLPHGTKVEYDSVTGHDRKVRAGMDGLTIKPESAISIDISVTTASFIAGRVTGATDQPLPHVWVEAFPAVSTKVSEYFRGRAITDTNGEYVINGLPPGAYYVGLGTLNQPSVKSPLAPTFYPTADRRDDATSVTVKAIGDSLAGIDLRVPSLPRTTLSGRLVYQDGQPAAGMDVEFRSPGVSTENTVTGKDGTFHLPVLANRQGELSATANIRQDPSCQERTHRMRSETVGTPSQTLRIDTAQARTGIVLTFPFRACDPANKPTP